MDKHRELSTPKPSRFKIVTTILLAGVISFMLTLAFYFGATVKYQLLIMRRADIVEAALKVEQEENKIIENKIRETKKQTVKKILSPLVVIEAK